MPSAAQDRARPEPSWLRRGMNRLDWLSARVIIAVMAIMVVVVTAQVFLRYALSASMDAADEIARLSFIWVVFMAIPHAVGLARHVGIDTLVKHLPVRIFAKLYYASCIAVGLLMLVVAYQAVVVARDSWDQLLPTLNISSSWFYVALVVSGLHSAGHFFLIVIEHEPAHLPATQEEPL